MVGPMLAIALCLAGVHDGDTVRACDGERIRLANIDAPELPGSERCNPRHLRGGKNPSWCDYALGVRSRDALRAFLSRGPVMVQRHGVDRYGRTLATLSVNGVDAGEYLVGLGLAPDCDWLRPVPPNITQPPRAAQGHELLRRLGCGPQCRRRADQRRVPQAGQNATTPMLGAIQRRSPCCPRPSRVPYGVASSKRHYLIAAIKQVYG